MSTKDPLMKHASALDYPTVTVVIVHYNGKRLIKNCLNSLRKIRYPKNRYEIIVVDNGSKDKSVEFIKRGFPEVRVFKNSNNNYCQANNMGVKNSQSEYVALLNNDAVVDQEWLASLVELAQSSEDVAVVGSKVLYLNKRIQSTGHERLPNYHWGDRGIKEKDIGQYESNEEVESVSNASALYRREALIKAGLFDENFHMYSEDLDMNYRMKRLGYKVMYAPKSVVCHKLRGPRRMNAMKQSMILKNRLRFLAKHYPDKIWDNFFGFGEVILLPDREFDDFLFFVQNTLPTYWKDERNRITDKAKITANELRSYRKRVFRTMPLFKIATSIRSWFS